MTPHKKVLIVEDHEDNAQAIAEFIRFVFPDWTIDQTAKGHDAIERVIKDPVDVLVLDIALADEVNGLDVIKKLWESGLREKPKVIITTAMGNKAFRGPRVGRPWVEQLNEHERTLVSAFFEKPYGWHAFLTAVAKAAGVDSPDKIKLIPDNE
jgi:CheY-like chemotaxis protein